MDKKDLKWYEAPAVEVVELKAEGFLCGSVVSGGVTIEEPEDE